LIGGGNEQKEKMEKGKHPTYREVGILSALVQWDEDVPVPAWRDFSAHMRFKME
jgi:hypothetical protein